MKKIVLYNDVTSRDLLPSVLLSKYLKLKNKRVKILPLFKASRYGIPTFFAQFLFSPDFVITPSYNYYRSPEVSWRSKISDSVLIHMPSEQYFSEGFLTEKIPWYDKNNQYQPDYYFVGSRYYAQLLQTHGKVDAKKIFIVGQIKLDVAAPGNQNNGKLHQDLRIIFVSDYSPADWTAKTLSTLEKNYKIKFTTEDVETIKAERDSAIQSAILLSERADCKVTFRLHPGEDAKNYRKAFSGTSVKLSDATVEFADDVSAHDIALGYTTTSVFEMTKMGVPFLSIHNYEYPSVVWRDYLKCVAQLSTKDLNLQSIDLLKLAKSRQSDKLSYYCYGLNSCDKPSYLLIDKALDKIKLGLKGRHKPAQMYRYSLKFILMGILAGLLRIIVLLFPNFLKDKIPYGSRFFNLVHPMHNFTSKELKLANPEISFQNSSQGDWELGNYGWEFKE